MNIYRLKVTLVGGPPWSSPNTWRTIEIKGSQTLDRLHRAIFRAYERWEEHLYSFYMSRDRGDGSQEYAAPGLFEDNDFPLGGKPRHAASTRLDQLGLTAGRKFSYMFDYGDGWEHKVEVLSIKQQEPEGRYPRIIERHGESPPQHGELSEGEEDYGEEEGEDEEPVRGRVIPLWGQPDDA